MSSICEFCQSILKTKASLKTHQTKSKKCINIQKEKGYTATVKCLICEFCSKTFLIENSLSRHLACCSIKRQREQDTQKKENDVLKQEIERLSSERKQEIERLTIERKQEIERLSSERKQETDQFTKERNDDILKIKMLEMENTRLTSENLTLKNKLEQEFLELKQKVSSNTQFFQKCTEKGIDKHSTSTTTMNNINLKNSLAEFCLTIDMVRKECEEKGTLQHLERGIRGLAELMVPLIELEGKPMMCVVDASRSNLKYLKDGTIENDTNANMLIQTIHDGALPQFRTIFSKAMKSSSYCMLNDNAVNLVHNFSDIKELSRDKNTKELIKSLHIPFKADLVPKDERSENERSENEREEKKEPLSRIIKTYELAEFDLT